MDCNDNCVIYVDFVFTKKRITDTRFINLTYFMGKLKNLLNLFSTKNILPGKIIYDLEQKIIDKIIL